MIVSFAKNRADLEDARAEVPPFEEFYRQYYAQVFGYVQKRLCSREASEDFCSDVFVYCFEHYQSYDPKRSKLSTWLYLIVNSRLKNYYRDKRETVEFGELENVLFDDSDVMDRAVYAEQLRSFLAKALLDLNEKQRKAVVMRFFQNLEYSEIADELGVSAGNARVILSRALDKLAESCARADFLPNA